MAPELQSAAVDFIPNQQQISALGTENVARIMKVLNAQEASDVTRQDLMHVQGLIEAGHLRVLNIVSRQISFWINLKSWYPADRSNLHKDEYQTQK